MLQNQPQLRFSKKKKITKCRVSNPSDKRKTYLPRIAANAALAKADQRADCSTDPPEAAAAPAPGRRSSAPQRWTVKPCTTCCFHI